jgi:hypothetical protein
MTGAKLGDADSELCQPDGFLRIVTGCFEAPSPHRGDDVAWLLRQISSPTPGTITAGSARRPMKAAARPLPEQEPVMRGWYLTFTSFLQVFFNLSADEGPNIDPLG